LVAVHFEQFLAPHDVRVQLDNFGMFGPQVFAEFFALNLQQFNLLEGRLTLSGGG
jgi:hypothetical protein